MFSKGINEFLQALSKIKYKYAWDRNSKRIRTSEGWCPIAAVCRIISTENESIISNTNYPLFCTLLNLTYEDLNIILRASDNCFDTKLELQEIMQNILNVI